MAEELSVCSLLKSGMIDLLIGVGEEVATGVEEAIAYELVAGIWGMSANMSRMYGDPPVCGIIRSWEMQMSRAKGDEKWVVSDRGQERQVCEMAGGGDVSRK